MSIPFRGRGNEQENASDAESRLAGAKTGELLRASRADRVMRVLAQRVDAEAMRMVPSLAKEMAKNGWQAELDGFRLAQAARLGSEAIKTAAQAMALNLDNAKALIESHPELEADVVEMLQEMNDLVKQLPRVGVVSYTARYYQNGAMRRDS